MTFFIFILFLLYSYPHTFRVGGGGVRVAAVITDNGLFFRSFVSGRLFGLSRSFVVCSFVRVRSGRSVGFLFGSTVRRPS